MSALADALAGIRRVMLLDAEVERLRERVAKGEDQLLDHDRRLIRIETLIEFGRPRLPRS